MKESIEKLSKKYGLSEKQECETCRGKGEVMLSCCTGDVVDEDFAICPTCYEHLGLEDCPDCEGTGVI